MLKPHLAGGNIPGQHFAISDPLIGLEEIVSASLCFVERCMLDGRHVMSRDVGKFILFALQSDAWANVVGFPC